MAGVSRPRAVADPSNFVCVCVCCAGDSWWRDNGSNFSVPLPGSKQQKEKKDRAQSFDDELR